MEVLLFALFFIFSLIFFIVGKDDFGRKEQKLITKEREKGEIKNEVELEPKEEVKNEVGLEPKEEVKKEVELEST